MSSINGLEEEAMASQNHAVIQFRIAVQLASLGEDYQGATELSLDMGTLERQEILKKHGLSETRELKPDVVLYRAGEFGLIDGGDELRTSTVPLLCVEIVSPTQGNLEILKKFKVYFNIGVKSCWYIDPILKMVLVYTTDMQSVVYHHGGIIDSSSDLVDQSLGIKIPLSKVFY